MNDPGGIIHLQQWTLRERVLRWLSPAYPMRILATLAVLAALIGGIVATAGTADTTDAYNCTSYRSGNDTYTTCR